MTLLVRLVLKKLSLISMTRITGEATAVKTARWLFHPGLKDRGYQAYRCFLVSINPAAV